MIKKVLGLLLRPPLPQLTGLALLTAVILVGGRAFRHVLQLRDATLYAICGGVWALAGAVFVWRRYQASKRAQLIEDRLRGQAREHKETVRPDRRGDVEALEKQLNEALGALKTSKMGKSALYALPWYVVIGPPGSGKTTLLRESGLSFPQMTHGRGVRGVGGTRNCDWWFTDAGILLDTAGRYTTQAEDRNEWIAFLDMLKKARSRKPINGALIAISIADVIQSTDEQLTEHARKIRERLAELTERLELVFPVYLLFTKCDLLDGFVDMFGSYTKKERAQVWGFTLPYLTKQPEPLAVRFGQEFDELYDRLCAERLHNLGGAKSQTKKRKVFSFPLQFSLARERLRAFVDQLVQPNPYHESSDVRGFYFTSGTQEGKPLDQILRTMRLASGLQTDSEPPSEAEVEKKAYFIDELFTQVVFPDQDLARSSAKAERRRRVLQRAGLIATGAATFVLMVLLFVAYAGQASLIQRSIRVCQGAAGFDPSNEEHLKREEASEARGTGPLEQLRQLFVELDASYGSVGTYLLGEVNQLYDKRVRPLYVEKLRATFVKPIQHRLQQDLTAAIEGKQRDPDVRVIGDQLTGYRMLGGEQTLNPDWLSEDFLTRQRLWTWRAGQEVVACRPHLVVFVKDVADPAFGDWAFLPERALMPKAAEVVRNQDILGRELETVIREQGQAEKVTWAQVFANHPQARLLGDSVGVTEAYFKETSFDDAFERKGELLGSNSAVDLKARRRLEAAADWTHNLAVMRPLPKSNIEECMKDVAVLTGNDSLYMAAYKEVCSRLQKLGIDCKIGDTAWLEATLKQIHGLEPVVQELYDKRSHLERIVRAAKMGEEGALGRIRGEFRKVRKAVSDQTETYADLPIRAAIKDSLMGTLNALQFALASEIHAETNAVWQHELGKTLGEFTRSFPFRATVDEIVEPDRFDAVFGKGGEFDKTAGWIRYLEQTAAEIGFVKIDPEFDEDRAFVRRLQQALFSTPSGNAGCDVEFLLQKRGNMKSVRFALGDAAIEAQASKESTIPWRTAHGASIKIQEFQAFDAKLDSALEQRGKWGLVRLLGEATTSTIPYRGKDYLAYVWSSFLHPKTNQPLAVGESKAEAGLLLRTAVEPNPLTPGFFTHKFAKEVFVAPSR